MWYFIVTICQKTQNWQDICGFLPCLDTFAKKIFEKTRGNYCMGLFKDIFCAKCGKKTRLLTRTRLADDNYLCSECTSMIPSYMVDSVCKLYSYEVYNNLIEYIDYSNIALRPIFQETHTYYNLHIDIDHGLFYIGKSIDDYTVFLRMRYIDDYADRKSVV